MLDLRQTLQYSPYMSSIGWIVERIDGVNYFIRKFPLIGSFIKIQRPEKISHRVIELLSKKYRAFQIVIEPARNATHSVAGGPKGTNYQSLIVKNGFKQSKLPFVPAKTIHIDLTKSESQLLKEMHHKTRYNIKLGKRLKVKVIISKDINLFADFWQECARKQRGMFLSQKKEISELYKAFGQNAHITLGFKDKKLVSGILLISTKDIAYTCYAASSDVGKKLFAPTLTVWEAIRLAKKLDCKIFDFEGIYDERFPLTSWKGFTRFKKSFGGKEVDYPGAFVKYKFPF